MDEIDMGSLRAEQDLERALKQRKPEGPEATGICLFCGEVVAPAKRWCDADCRDEWQRRIARAGVRGVRA